MTSPLERAKFLDAEMRLQRAWLELNLRELQEAASHSMWGRLRTLNRSFKLGSIGLSLIKNRSLWLAALSMVLNFYRRHAKK